MSARLCRFALQRTLLGVKGEFLLRQASIAGAKRTIVLEGLKTLSVRHVQVIGRPEGATLAVREFSMFNSQCSMLNGKYGDVKWQM